MTTESQGMSSLTFVSHKDQLKSLIRSDPRLAQRLMDQLNIESKTDDASSAKEGGTMVTDTTTTGSGAGNESSAAEE